MKIVKPSVTLLWVTPNAEQMIEAAGRTAYKSEDKITDSSAPKFIRKLIELGHESVLEHACASVRIICDRGVSHEMVRHRLASYTQESTRFCDYKGIDLSIVEPLDFYETRSYGLWNEAIQKMEEVYTSLRNLRVSPQFARSILPTCLKTELVMTTNFREWRHILRLRTSKKAHPQMQEIANMILGLLSTLSPACFRWEDFPDVVPFCHGSTPETAPTVCPDCELPSPEGSGPCPYCSRKHFKKNESWENTP